MNFSLENLKKYENSDIKNKLFYIATYGCQMNEEDSENIWCIKKDGIYKNF